MSGFQHLFDFLKQNVYSPFYITSAVNYVYAASALFNKKIIYQVDLKILLGRKAPEWVIHLQIFIG